MISIPYEKIIEKLKEKGLTEEEIELKIKQKIDSLAGLISKEGAAHIIANELGIQLLPKLDKNIKIKDLFPGLRNLEINGKVIAKYEINEFETEKAKGKVASFIIADDTGTARVVLWHDKTSLLDSINVGDTIKLKGVYAKDNNSRIELHFNENSSLVKIDEEIDIKRFQRKKISELKEGDENIEILATIVQVFDPRSFNVCPECFKRIEDVCEEHQKKAEKHYVLNMIVDDGSEIIRVVLWKNQIKNLLKLDDEKLDEMLSEEKFSQIKKDLLGSMVKFVGKVKKNDLFDRLEFIASLVFPDVNPEEELKILEDEI